MFGSLKPRGRFGVLVVDLVNGFTDPRSKLGMEIDDTVEATVALLATARERDLPVIFTTLSFEPGLADAGVWPEKIPGLADLVEGSEWVELDPRLGRLENEAVVVKKGASACFGTNLPAILVAAGVGSVMLTGATTSGCVRATAVDLIQLGYPTFVPRECVGDRDQAQHDANLIDLEAKYANLLSLSEAQQMLSDQASASSRSAS